MTTLLLALRYWDQWCYSDLHSNPIDKQNWIINCRKYLLSDFEKDIISIWTDIIINCSRYWDVVSSAAAVIVTSQWSFVGWLVSAWLGSYGWRGMCLWWCRGGVTWGGRCPPAPPLSWYVSMCLWNGGIMDHKTVLHGRGGNLLTVCCLSVEIIPQSQSQSCSDPNCHIEKFISSSFVTWETVLGLGFDLYKSRVSTSPLHVSNVHIFMARDRSQQ